jgi:hypothetical protein
MLYREIIAVCSEIIIKKDTNAICGQNAEFQTVTQTLRFKWLIIKESLQFSYPISFEAVTRQSHTLTNTALVGQDLLIIGASRSHSDAPPSAGLKRSTAKSNYGQ